ncbi:anaerobic sulfite reductase subunit B [Candidatus Moduliflexus flocculans]|uniref:Anaerobic sulfite reductase subunit B n=1 Tax=Candidatus Moduliflexus flocculans TaxID=1499966 RepID=A0A081BPH2_9BACT|nr:anaerobic sulfite reductase subunit B [Candidatus Moduliflexus flocculans]
MEKNPYAAQPARILEIRPETAIDWTFRLAWNNNSRSGQFFQVSVPKFGESPISVSDFGDGWLDMTIRNVGLVTSEMFKMTPGDRLYLRGPYGNGFDAAAFAGRHIIVAAGGTGLAPVKGLIRQFAAGTPPTSRLDIVVGFKTPADVLFRDDLAAWKRAANLWLTVDRATSEWADHVGVIPTLVPKIPLNLSESYDVIIVGPPLMMKFTVQAFLERGVAPERIWVSYERRMSCGVGKCGHCKIDDVYICQDGPVFNYSRAQWLMD